MFDDYDYKLTDKRIQFKFSQKYDESFYPWEIASFLKDLNTTYYKYDLLNSISSALNYGIDPKDILILSKSLPLYKTHGDLDIINYSENGLNLFYFIGDPYSLSPNINIERTRLFLLAFKLINKKLHQLGFKPLFTKTIPHLFEQLPKIGLSDTIELNIKEALKRSKPDNIITKDDFAKEIAYIQKSNKQLTDDFKTIKDNSDQNLETYLNEKTSKKIKRNYYEKFFFHFNKIQRPLVCIKEGNHLRVLGRALVNKEKSQKHGLELKEMTRNSPLKSLFEGGVAVYRTVKEEERSKELHNKKIELINVEKSIMDEKLKQEKLKSLRLEIELAEKMEEIAKSSDVEAYKDLDDNFYTQRILEAYRYQDKSRISMLERRGLDYKPSETKIIDIKA